jgi:hypothetical protein
MATSTPGGIDMDVSFVAESRGLVPATPLERGTIGLETQRARALARRAPRALDRIG